MNEDGSEAEAVFLIVRLEESALKEILRMVTEVDSALELDLRMLKLEDTSSEPVL